MHLSREIIGGRLWAGINGNQNDNQTDATPGADNSFSAMRDDDPQSGGSAGKIFDLDAPGVVIQTTQPTPNFVYRFRINFDAWAEYKVDGAWIRCSEKKPWFARLSLKLTGAFDSNSANSGTATTLKRDAATWTVNEWAGGVVNIVNGFGFPQARRVSSNTTNTIRVSRDWDTIPTAFSVYRLIKPDSWTILSDVLNDNQSGDGTTIQSWNLE